MKSPPIDFHQLVSLQIRSIQLTGLWFYIPHPKTSVGFWLHVLMRIIYGVLVFIVPPIGQITYVVKLFASGNYEIQHIASSINLILTELLVSFKLFDLYFRRQLLTQLLDQLISGEFLRTTHRKMLENAIKLSRRLFWCFLTCSALDVFIHMIVVPGLGRFQTLPVKMDLIFIDVNEPPYFDYICFYQIFYKPILVLLYIALQTLPWSLLLFAIAQLDILIDNFKHLEVLVKAVRTERQCGEDEAFKEVFNSLIFHHRAIIRYSYHKMVTSFLSVGISVSTELFAYLSDRDGDLRTSNFNFHGSVTVYLLATYLFGILALFVDTTEATFGGQFALTLILSSCVICFTGVQFLSIESPSHNLVAVFWVMAYLQIFVLIMFTDCYFGNSVYVKSTDLATIAYGTPWLKMPRELKKNLVLVIARAQKPLVITAYNLVPISLPTFTKVMNWTYKAFAVMNGMKK